MKTMSLLVTQNSVVKPFYGSLSGSLGLGGLGLGLGGLGLGGLGPGLGGLGPGLRGLGYNLSP